MNTLKKVTLILILLQKAFCGSCQSNAQQQAPVKYTPKQLQEDYSIFRKTLETAYPSLYRFTDSVIMTKYLDNGFRSLDQPESEMEFYQLIARTCAQLHDEHFSPQPPKDYTSALVNQHHYFPFSLKVIDRRFYILKTAQHGGPIPAGSEILSINGRSAEEIQNILLPTISSDGYTGTFGPRHLEDYSMTEEDNFFDFNYPIFVEDTDAFRIEFIDPSDRSKKQVATIAGLDYKAYKNFFYVRNPLKAPLEFKYLKKDVAYLRISSFLGWHRNRFKQNFDSLYTVIFKELKSKHIPNLILDLRNNEGGDGTGERLLTYLMTKPYRHFAAAELRYAGYPDVVDNLEPPKDDLFFPDSMVTRTNTGLYALKEKYLPLLSEQQPKSDHFQGKLYVLINGASGSQAAVAASLLKGNGRAVFIGEESGGTMEGITARYGAGLVLPNTKIRVHFGLLKTSNAVAYTKGRGVEPDYPVIPKIDDVLKGVDTELNFTLGLIEAKK
jgi:hypothetical protein